MASYGHSDSHVTYQVAPVRRLFFTRNRVRSFALGIAASFSELLARLTVPGLYTLGKTILLSKKQFGLCLANKSQTKRVTPPSCGTPGSGLLLQLRQSDLQPHRDDPEQQVPRCKHVGHGPAPGRFELPARQSWANVYPSKKTLVCNFTFEGSFSGGSHMVACLLPFSSHRIKINLHIVWKIGARGAGRLAQPMN